MNASRRGYSIAVLLVAYALGTGCGPRQDETRPTKTEHAHDEADGHDHDHDHEHEHGHEREHEHDHEEESPSGGSFKPGRGVVLTDETRASLDVEVGEVVERKLAAEIRFTAQIFGEKHHHLPNLGDHSGCDVHGSGFVAEDVAAILEPGNSVQIRSGTNEVRSGAVLAIQKAIALGESEVIIGISNAVSLVRPGAFVPATITRPGQAPVATVPQSAVLRTSEGTFVYTVNGDAYLRTAVRTGAESEGWVAIPEGLPSGARVVVKPVKTLWLIELRATKGGGHTH